MKMPKLDWRDFGEIFLIGLAALLCFGGIGLIFYSLAVGIWGGLSSVLFMRLLCTGTLMLIIGGIAVALTDEL